MRPSGFYGHGARSISMHMYSVALFVVAHVVLQSNAQDVFISQLNSSLFSRSDAPAVGGWWLSFTRNSSMQRLLNLAPMTYTTTTATGNAGWEAAMNVFCVAEPRLDRHGLFVHPSASGSCGSQAFGYCAPVMLFSVPDGFQVTRLRLNTTFSNGGFTDGVDVTVYSDGASIWQSGSSSAAVQNVHFNGSAALSTVAVRLDPRATCDDDGTTVVVDVFGENLQRGPNSCYISTAAGSGMDGFSGDGLPAAVAALGTPSALTYIPGSGDLIVTSRDQHVIRIVYAANGTIGTFAGNGSAGFSGDGRSAVAAQLSTPNGVAALTDGSTLICDRDNSRIRVVWPNGTIDTWMGDGTAASSGDGRFRLSARVNRPRKISVHPLTGDVYVSEISGGFIRRIDGRTGIVSTLVGSPGSNATVELAIVQAENLFALPNSTDAFVVSDSTSNRVYLINSASRTAMLLAGTGTASFNGDRVPALLASLSAPSGVLFHGPSMTVLVADNNNKRVRAFPIGGAISTVAGNGSSSSATGFDVGDGGLATAAVLIGPTNMAFHPSSGSVAISDGTGHRVRVVSAACLPSAISVSRVMAAVALVISCKAGLS